MQTFHEPFILTKRNTTDLYMTTVHYFRSYSHESTGNTVLFKTISKLTS
jgi:hypothetical protein